jgi:hypothetical protein
MCTFHTYSMLLKILTFAQHASTLSEQVYRADHAYLAYLMLQRLLSHVNDHKLDHLKLPLMSSMSGFTLSCTTNMFILMILYGF